MGADRHRGRIPSRIRDTQANLILRSEAPSYLRERARSARPTAIFSCSKIQVLIASCIGAIYVQL